MVVEVVVDYVEEYADFLYFVFVVVVVVAAVAVAVVVVAAAAAKPIGQSRLQGGCRWQTAQSGKGRRHR